jgi:hypothetical protein
LLLAELGDQPTTIVVVTARHDDTATLLREGERRCAPDAGQGTGDQNHWGLHEHLLADGSLHTSRLLGEVSAMSMPLQTARICEAQPVERRP